MKPINYREKQASTYLAAQRKIDHNKQLRLFFFMLAFFIVAVLVLVFEIITY